MSDSRYIDDQRKTSNGCPVAKRVPRAAANYRVPSKNVAAIDFGTTNCSVAYLTASDDPEKGPQRLTLNSTHNRVPTAILFNQNGKFASFGHEARNDYIQSLDDADRLNYYYFEEIKMNLQLDEVSLTQFINAVHMSIDLLREMCMSVALVIKTACIYCASNSLCTFGWAIVSK